MATPIRDILEGASVYELARLNNFSALVDPTVNDDETLGYRPLSQWLNDNTQVLFVCTNATAGAANWVVSATPTTVSSVNGQSGAVTIDADDIDDAATTNKFVTAGDLTNLGNLSGTNSGDEIVFAGTTGTPGQNDGNVPDDGVVASGRYLKDDGSWDNPPGEVTQVNGQSGVVTLDTDDVAEGATNKYASTANVDAAGATMNTDTSLAGNGWFKNDSTFASPDATKVPSEAAVKTYVDNSVASALEYKGGYNAGTNTPNLTTPAPGAVSKGDCYAVDVAGTFFGVSLEVGDLVIAEINNPAAIGDWTVLQANLTPSSIKTQYESNANTNAFTDAYQTQLNNLGPFGAHYVFAESKGISTTTSATWTTKVSVAIPSGAATGTYRVSLALKEGGTTAGTDSVQRVRLLANGVQQDDFHEMDTNNDSDYIARTLTWRVAHTTGVATTLAAQYSNGSASGTSSFKDFIIEAWRVV